MDTLNDVWVDEHKSDEVDVPAHWKEGTTPDTIYPHECFYRAYRYIADLDLHLGNDDGVYLIHGECCLAWGAHAWVELPGGIVFDGVRQRFYSQAVLGPAAVWYKYTRSAANLLAANICRKAPACYAFYEPLKLPWGDPSNPLVIDFDKAVEYLVSSGIRPDLAKKPRKRSR
jgi:hypothetical protein